MLSRLLLVLGFTGTQTGRAILQNIEARACNAHDKLTQYFLGVISMIITVIILNLVGLKIVNLWAICFLNIVFMIAGTRPRVLATTGTIGWGLNNDAEDGAERGLGILGDFSLYINLFFLASGIFTYRNNPAAIPLVIGAIITIFLMDWRWGFKTKYFKSLAYVSTLVAIIFGLMSFIPRAGYIKTIGFYPYAFLQTTELEEQVSDMEKTETKVREKGLINQLKLIETKIQNGEGLSNKEKNLLFEQKKARDRASIPGSLKKAFQKWGAAEASGVSTVLIKPVGLERGIHLVNQNAGELSGWKEPEGAGKLRIDSADEGYLLIMSDGTKIPSSNIKSYAGGPFKFYAITDQRQSSIIIED